MKKLFLCFFGAVFCTANLFAADGVVISRSIPTKNVSQTREISESHRNVVQRSGVENTRVATRNTKRTNAVSRKTKSDFWMLIFSMTGYILISLTVMPLFFLMPYFSLAYIAHGKCAAVKYNESFDFSNKQYTVVAK